MGPRDDEGELRALAARAVTRDPDAWEALYRRTYAGLFAYARRRLASDAEADDAVSETMSRALRRITDFRWRGGGIQAWLYGILRNVVIEAHRRSTRAAKCPAVETAERQGDEGEPLNNVLAHEEALSIRAAFCRLSEEDREILELRVVAGLSAEAVSHVIGKRAGAVRMAQARALNRLRTAFAEVSGGY